MNFSQTIFALFVGIGLIGLSIYIFNKLRPLRPRLFLSAIFLFGIGLFILMMALINIWFLF